MSATETVERQAVAPRVARPTQASVQDSRAWARALEARDAVGESLTDAQREMYRDALRTFGAEKQA